MVAVEKLTEGIDKYMFVLTLQWCEFCDKKQCRYEDISLPKWWHMALTNSRLFRVYLNNHEQSSTLDIFFKKLENAILWNTFSSAYNVTQIHYVNTWACPTPLNQGDSAFLII